jgi:predicted phosphodiesterase
MKRSITLLLKLALVTYGLSFPLIAQNGNGITAPRRNGNGAAIQRNGLKLPMAEDSIKFIAIGDTGTGSRQQLELAKIMLNYHKVFPYEFVIMVGDNMYGGEKPNDFQKKFEAPYKPLLDVGVKFYASLGNHDESNQRFYQLFNMSGEEYYRFKKGDAAFYALNSNYMDKRQIEWIQSEMAKDDSKWKIAFFHHPPYSSGGKHGSSVDVREVLEPIFVKNGVDVVFTGHEHFYERIKPQSGIFYFITGAGGKLRKGDVKKGSPLTAVAYDADLSFMLVEIHKDLLHFQVMSRTGKTVDSGALPRREVKNPNAP